MWTIPTQQLVTGKHVTYRYLPEQKKGTRVLQPCNPLRRLSCNAVSCYPVCMCAAGLLPFGCISLCVYVYYGQNLPENKSTYVLMPRWG